MPDTNTITEVIDQFICQAAPESLKPYGSGHINDSFFLKSRSLEGPDYLLQRINSKVFGNVPALMSNMLRVTRHLKEKIRERGSGDAEKEVMTLIPAKDGKYYYQDEEGEYWRMFYFLRNTKSYDLVETEKQAYEGGKAFGKFQAMLSDIPAGELYAVIPDFHNIQKRLQQLEAAVKQDACGRADQSRNVLGTVMRYAGEMQYFQQPEQVAKLPVRVIHNDTKFNNVLLNERDEAQCVIDLETVMDGYVAYDFGDAIRTIINTAVEDEADLDKIQLNMPLFKAYTKGYLEQAGSFLEASELQSLVKGILLLPYMQAVRFLTDHLNGDVYFKVKFAGHNLQRAKAQLALLHQLMDRQGEMEAQIRENKN